MKRRIWIVNYYTSPEASNPRYLEFAKHFIAEGWDVTTFYADYNSTDTGKQFEHQQVNGLDFVRVKAPHFKGNGLKRMFSIWSFANKLYCNKHNFEKPDVILHNIHPPFDYPIVKLAKKLKSKYIAEAWDLWPDAFVYMGLISASNPITKWAYSIERKYYYSADEIVFTFLGAYDYLKRQGWMKEQGGEIEPAHVHHISNGINLAQFDDNAKKYRRADADINSPNFIKIVYLGSINFANNVKTLIDAARLLQGNPQYRFFIYGNGAYREGLEKYVKENNIDNVVFKEKYIPLEECAWVVSQARVGVMNYEKGFGRMGVSSGKMFQYLAAGKPIVCNVRIDYDDILTENNIGIARDMDSAEDIANAIRQLAEQSEEDYNAMCKRVRSVAKEFDYKNIASKELKVIESLTV